MSIEIIDMLFILIIALAVLSWEKIGLAVQELARGGPRPPSHPLLGDDSKFLNRARARHPSFRNTGIDRADYTDNEN